MQAIIEAKGLKKNYNGAEALKGISFHVEKGEVFGILGPNGAGKTTTLEILEGIKKKTEGSVWIFGKDLDEQSETIKKRIGVQLQSSGYFDYLSLTELIRLFAAFYETQVDEAQILGFVGLREKTNALYKNLSGGQKQRFTIATSLVNQPEILFLDEPTTGLDPKARRELWQLIRDINSKGVTIVLTTHYMEEAEYLCNRVAILHRGVILTINHPRNLINEIEDSVEISFFTASSLSNDFFSGISEIKKIYSNYPKVILEAATLDAVQKVIARLNQKHIQFTGFTAKTATLEDVYLHLTGREFEDAV